MSVEASGVATPSARRRQRRSLVVLAGDERTSDRGARALADSLSHAGIRIHYIGREKSAHRIALAAAAAGADTVDFCVAGAGGIALLRDLLRELKDVTHGAVSIVVHRVQ